VTTLAQYLEVIIITLYNNNSGVLHEVQRWLTSPSKEEEKKEKRKREIGKNKKHNQRNNGK
jgi:hypothetical protein